MISRRLCQVARTSGVVVVVTGLLALVGWVFGIQAFTRVLPGFVTMKPNAALAFVAAGASLLLQIAPHAPRRRARAARACALLITAIGTITALEYVLGVDLHIDGLLIRPPAHELYTSSPGRMALLTATSFSLLGASLGLLDAKARTLRLISQTTACVVLLIGFVACTGYLLGATTFYSIPGFTAMAVHTATSFTALATGVLLCRPQRGIVAVLVQDNPAGGMLRRSLVVSVAILMVIGWLRLAGQEAGLYSAQVGAVAGFTTSTFAIVLIALWNAGKQRAAEQAALHSQRDERFLFELGDWLRTSERSGDLLSQVSAKLGEHLGVSRCLFAEIDLRDMQATIRRDYHLDLPSLEGKRSLAASLPDDLAAWHAGQTVANNDASMDERTAVRYEAVYRALGIRSYIAAPLQRHGRWVAMLMVSTQRARVWHAREIALIQAVAERTWLWFEHLTALEVLREREQHLAAVLDAAFDAIVSTDETGVIVEFNRAAERIFGHRRDQVLGKAMADVLVPASHHDAFRQVFAQAADAVEPRVRSKPTQLPAIGADGSELATEIAITRVPDREPPRFTAFTRDITERRRSMEQILLAIEAAPTGMILVDRDGNIALVNAQLEKLFGHPREELVGKPVELLIPDRFRRQHPQLRKAFLGDPRFHTMGAGRELFGLHRDGREIPVTIALNPFHMEHREFVLSSVVDITERRRAEKDREDLLGQLGALNAELEVRVNDRTARLTAALREREVLLQEVHHRVKNNLQIISSLIKLQTRKIEDVDNRSGLEECRRRVEAIALIHEQLYQAKDCAQVPFSDYVRRLVGNVFHATSASHPAVTLGVDLEDISLPVDKAIPCGLILNELITNALKHAFPDSRSGSIQIELRQTVPGEVALAVRDDGVGTAEDLAPTTSSSLGMRLIAMLAKQIHGRLDVKRNQGMTFQVTFPLTAAAHDDLATS